MACHLGFHVTLCGFDNMKLSGIKALTCDTGGTVLDWHTGFRRAFQNAGKRHGISRDWLTLANELRRRSLAATANQGRVLPPSRNFDEAHRICLDALLAEERLEVFDAADRTAIAWTAPHSFTAWPDVQDGLTRLRTRYIVASFTLLSYRLVIDSSRANGLTWDAVLSCEGLGIYKREPEAYLRAAALLQLMPSECLMVACHTHDLDAAKAVGFKTAMINRPLEWGPDGPKDKAAANDYDLTVDSFIELAASLPSE